MTSVRCAVGLLKLNRFRNHVATGVETGGCSIALFGPNGAGKTNVLEAVSLLVPGRGLRRAALDEVAHRPDGSPDGSGWRIRAQARGIGGAVELMTGSGDGAGGRAVEIDDGAATQAALGDRLRMVWLTPVMDRLWLEGAGARRRFLDRVALGFFPDHGEVSLAYEKAMRARNRLLKDGVNDPAWLGALEARMGRQGARIARNRALALTRLSAARDATCALFPRADLAILNPMENRFAEAIRSHGSETENLDRTEDREADDLIRELAAGRARDQAAGRALTGPHRADIDAVYAAKNMPARACSTGEQKALLISVILANVRALKASGVTPIVLLDEVAAHLDPDRRAALHAKVAALDCQAWMTGTDSELFRDLPAPALRAEVSDDGAGARLEIAS